MKVSERTARIGESATLAVTARAVQMKTQGIDVVSFGAGEPDFDTPAYIKQAAEKALNAGDTKYTPRAGKALLAAIAEKLARENKINVEPNQIVMTLGGKHALFTACQCLIDPGDKVLIPAPYWVSYPEMVRLAGGEPVIINTRRQNGFKITPQQVLDNARGAKLIIINSPSNPTGVTYTPDELSAIAQAVLKTDMIVFSDEIYEKLIYGDARFVSFAALDPRLPERTITFNGLSKTYAMTGWRLGWAAGPKDAIGAMRRHISHATSDAVSFAQAGALAAYTDPQGPATIETMRLEFQRRARHMTDRLNAIHGVHCVEPTGAFYCFPDVAEHFGRTLAGVQAADSLSFAKAALEGSQVALVPGDSFGNDACVRLSFATSMEQIDKGLDRLEKLLK